MTCNWVKVESEGLDVSFYVVKFVQKSKEKELITKMKDCVVLTLHCIVHLNYFCIVLMVAFTDYAVRTCVLICFVVVLDLNLDMMTHLNLLYYRNILKILICSDCAIPVP